MLYPTVGQIKPRFGSYVGLNYEHPLNKGLVAWWLMNEGVGNKIKSVYGLLNQGTITVPMWINTLESGLYFDGTDDGVIVSNVSSIFVSGMAQVTVHVRCMVPGSGNYVPIEIGASSVFQLFISGTTVRFAINADWAGASTVTGLTYGVINNLIGVYPGANPVMYRNYTPAAAGTTSGAVGAATDATIGMGTGAGYKLLGSIYTAGIWNRALSLSEIYLLNSNPYGTPDSPRLLIEPRRTWFVPTVAGMLRMVGHTMGGDANRMVA